jgi:hypothetical protein
MPTLLLDQKLNQTPQHQRSHFWKNKLLLHCSKEKKKEMKFDLKWAKTRKTCTFPFLVNFLFGYKTREEKRRSPMRSQETKRKKCLFGSPYSTTYESQNKNFPWKLKSSLLWKSTC